MDIAQQRLSDTFVKFVDSEKSSGVLLIVCTLFSLLITNSTFGPTYLGFWQVYVGGLNLQNWINDGLMAVFFLLVGLELERELYSGELAEFRNALLPIVAATGGMVAPALIHFSGNAGTSTQAGFGIPMATDIAFPLGVLAILGNRIPPALKVFVVALAVIDDLGAVVVIAAFYTAQPSVWYILGTVGIWILLFALNRVFRVMSLLPYLLGGAVMWFLMLKSGIHPTIAGVLLAFAIPFSSNDNDLKSPSHKLEDLLHKPVAFIVLPVFALTNTGIVFGPDWMDNLASTNGVGIIAGLILGKPLGVVALCGLAVATGISRLPSGLNWKHISGAGILCGIGFTMSIFIANLAFIGNAELINAAKMAILLASLTAGTVGFVWLKLLGRPEMTSNKTIFMDKDR